MKNVMKTKLAAVAGSAILAVSASLPANAAVVLGGEDGWEVSYGGFINLFYNQTDFEFDTGPGVPNASEDSSHLNEGLLPAFHTMTVKTPEVNGLRGTGQITFAVDSSGNKDGRLNKAGVAGTASQIDMREVFFNVEGDFGTISAGRTLSLFQRQAILKDMTLFGVGALAGPDGSGTALGRIGFGYVYPDFRTRFTYKTPDINGFNLEVGIFDPQEPIGAAAAWETDTPQFQAEATYTTPFEGGSFNVWAGLLWQEQTMLAGIAPGADVESFGYNVGVDISFQGFNIMGSYYDGEALGLQLFNTGVAGDGFSCGVVNGNPTCIEADNDGYIIQGSYTFNGKTKLGVSYGESDQDASIFTSRMDNSLMTVGVYHDVNSWLKVVAEYNQYNSNNGPLFGSYNADGFSVGGFLLW